MWAGQLSALTGPKRKVQSAASFYVYTHRHPVGQFEYGNLDTPIEVGPCPLKGLASTPPQLHPCKFRRCVNVSAPTTPPSRCASCLGNSGLYPTGPNVSELHTKCNSFGLPQGLPP